MQHGKPHGAVERKDQPEAGDGQAGCFGVAERFVVPKKPGNAGGGKGPQFKTNATSGKGQEIGQPINSEKCPETADGVTRERWREFLSESRMRETCLSGSMSGM
jgi:hypothetical protein